jgi:carbamoylphosphate synthase small subunit
LSKRTDLEAEPLPVSKPATNFFNRVAKLGYRRVKPTQLDDIDVEKILKELRAERSKKAATKKAATKKAATKKAATKKAATKKAATKKAATKKAATKKAATKKAATKKAAR